MRSELAKTDFISTACKWLRFLGWLDEPQPVLPFADELERFVRHLRDDRGLADATIHGRRVYVESFFRWLAARGRVISSVTAKDISEHFSADEFRAWNRVTVAHLADSLRSFFTYAALGPGVRLGSQPPSIDHVCTVTNPFLKDLRGKTFGD
jgi:hypothetical protein